MNKNHLILFLLLIILSKGSYSQSNWGISLQNELQKKEVKGDGYDILIKGDKSELLSIIQKNGIGFKYSVGDWIAIHLNYQQLSNLVKLDCIEELFFDTGKGFLLNDEMIANANVSGLQEIGIYDSLLTGKDVIIGFIDSGLDYSHPDFINEDGSTRILCYWDQKNPLDSNDIFQDYGYGKYISQDTINAWLDSNYQYIMDSSNYYGHGTTVVGSACSNGRALSEEVENGTLNYDFHGVAPKSSIIMVSSDFSRNNWLASVADGVHFMLDKAEELNKAIVINLSVGSYSGSHDGLDPVGSIINAWFSDEYSGRMLVCAGGNSRSLRYHLGYNSTLDTSFSMYFSFNGPAELGRMSYFELWLDSLDVDAFENKIALYDAGLNQYYSFQSGFTDVTSNVDTTIIDTLFNVDSSIMAILKKQMQNRGDQIQFQVQVDNISDNNLKTVLYTKGNARVDTWSATWIGSSDIIGPESLPFSIVNDENYMSPDSLMQVVSSFSCAENVITVANYKNRVTYTDVNNVVQNLGGQTGELALHSSRGPTRDGRVKPDLAASGELILSAGPFNYLSILLAAAPFKLAEGGWHMRNGGTSMASPIVAGIAALYLQRCPKANPSDIKEALINSSYQDIFTNTLPNNNWGYGKVDGLATLNQSLEDITIVEDYLGCDDALVNLSIQGDYSGLQWNTGDTTINICVDAGDYWVYGIDNKGCLQRSENLLIAESSISTYKEDALKLYPNPNDGTFTIVGNFEIDSFQIINILGQTQQFISIKNSVGIQIELKNKNAGLYFLIDNKTGSYSELVIQ